MSDLSVGESGSDRFLGYSGATALFPRPMGTTPNKQVFSPVSEGKARAAAVNKHSVNFRDTFDGTDVRTVLIHFNEVKSAGIDYGKMSCHHRSFCSYTSGCSDGGGTVKPRHVGVFKYF